MRFLLVSLTVTAFLFLVRLVRRAALGSHTRSGPRQNGGGEGASSEQGWGQSSGQPKAARSPYEVLQVRPGASQEEIAAAYRRLVQQYHPDKVAGLGPELRELAERRMKEINAAYEQLKR